MESFSWNSGPQEYFSPRNGIAKDTIGHGAAINAKPTALKKFCRQPIEIRLKDLFY